MNENENPFTGEKIVDIEIVKKSGESLINKLREEWELKDGKRNSKSRTTS